MTNSGRQIAEQFTTSHGTFFVPINDEWIGKTMSTGRHWEQNILTSMLEVLPEGGTYVDCGSFVGTHSIPMAKKAGMVLAFEPQRHIFQMLCANAVNNNVSNLYPFNCALGHLNHNLISMNGVVPDGTSRGRKLEYGVDGLPINYGGIDIGKGGDQAEMRTLESIYEQLGETVTGCDVLKVDVQGAEPLMFYGAKSIIEKYKPSIFYEVDGRFSVSQAMHDQMTIPDEVTNFDIVQFTKQLGYSAPVQLGPCDFLLRRPTTQ